MADIAELGFQIDSSQAASAASNLDKMTQASARAESGSMRVQRQAEQTAASVRRMSSSVLSVGADFNTLDDIMAGHVKTVQGAADAEAALDRLLGARKITLAEQNAALAALDVSTAKLSKGMKVAETAAKDTSQAFAGLTSNSRVMYSASALLTDALSGQFSRSKREVAALANETGVLGGVFKALISPVGIFVGLAAAAAIGIGYFAVRTVEAHQNVEKFDQAIVATNGYAGQTAQSLNNLADSIAHDSVSYKDAAEAVLVLAQSGKFAGETLNIAAEGAAAFADLSGESIKNTAKEFEALADKPTQALLKLNDQTHLLDASTIALVAATEDAGNKFAAGTIATQAFAAATEAARVAQEGMNQKLAELQTAANPHVMGAMAADMAALNGTLAKNASVTQAAVQAQMRLAQAQAASKIISDAVSDSVGHLVASLESEKAKLDEETATYGKGKVGLAEYTIEKAKAATQSIALAAAETAFVTALKNGDSAFQAGKEAYAQYNAALSSGMALIDKEGAALLKSAKAADAAAAAHKGAGAAAREHAQDEQLLNSILDKAAQSIERVDNLFDQYSSGLGGPWIAAQNKYNATLKELDAAYEAIGTELANGVISQDEYNAKLQEFIDVSQLAGQALDDQQQKIIETTDILGNFDEQTQYEIEALKTSGLQHEVYTALLRAENEARKLYNQGLRETPNLYQYEIDGITKDVQAHHDLDVATRQSQDALKAWGDVARNAFDGATSDFSKWVVEGGSFMSSLKDTAKQTVEAIIAQFLKLQFLGPFMHSLFGDAANAMGFSSAGMSGMQGMGGIIGSLFGGGGGSSFGGSGSIIGSIAQAFGGGSSGGSLFNPTSWLSAGKTLYDGFQSGFSSLTTGAGNLSASLFGTETYTPIGAMGPPSDLASGFMGPSSSLAGSAVPAYGGYGSALGQGLGIAGGVYAGYNEFNAAGGGVAGLAGGAAYGVGTYLVGAGVTAAMAGGASAGIAAMGALGPVGWVALAAMAINMISGGKLFGTAAKPIGGDFTTTIGDTGATLTNVLHEKGQKALFGGAYYKDKNLPVDQQAIDAANQFFDALKKGTTDFAAQFGLTMTDIVGGTFVQKYDKNGKPTTTTDTVLGVTYTGETSAQFQERLQADSYLAVLDKMGVGASAYVKGLQGDADALFKAVQDLAAASQAAYADINRGIGLLGPDGNLGDVMAEVEKLAGSGEALADAYKRLVTENDAWKSSMEASILTLGKSAAQTLEFADALAKAFGSASAMQQALATFDKTYYTAGELSAIQIANDQAKLATAGAAIGQSPTETLAQFKAAFQQVESSLSPDQLAKWINFGNLLAQVNSEVQSAASSYAQFMAQFSPATSGFEQAMQKVSDTLAANIAQANSLAQANGAAGASAADIGKIISASVMQGVQAVQALETEAANLAQTLFQGDLASQIAKVKAEADAGNMVAGAQLMGLLKQQADTQAGAAKQQQFMQAAQLLGDLGQIGAVTGQGLGDFSKMFGIPLDKFASILGTDQSGLQAEFKKQEDMAKSALETANNTKYSNELQADILATLQGKASPFSTADLYAALTGGEIANPAAPGGKTGARGATGGPVANGTATSNGPSGTSSDPVTTKNPDTTTAVTNQTTQIVPLLKDIRDGLRDRTAVRDRYYSQRNTRPMMA